MSGTRMLLTSLQCNLSSHRLKSG